MCGSYNDSLLIFNKAESNFWKGNLHDNESVGTLLRTISLPLLYFTIASSIITEKPHTSIFW